MDSLGRLDIGPLDLYYHLTFHNRDGDMQLWQFALAQSITLISILLAFYSAHRANVKRIEEAARDFQDMKTKVDLMFSWFRKQMGLD